MIDILLITDGNTVIRRIDWLDRALAFKLEKIWEHYIGRRLSEIPAFQPDRDAGKLQWNEESFLFAEYALEEDCILFFLEQDRHEKALYEAALDYVDESIQIYDKDATILFLNKGTERITGFPSELARGKHLLDVYGSDEDFSTVLSTIRTRGAVKNRYAYYDVEGRPFTTLNNGYPVFEDGRFVGVICREESMDLIRQRLVKLNSILEAFGEKPSEDNSSVPVTFEHFAGESNVMKQLIRSARDAAGAESSIMVLGEPGTGKGRLAQAIVSEAGVPPEKLVVLNCPALRETELEARLFGRMEEPAEACAFEAADGGALILAEIQYMSLRLQSRLFNVLRDGSFETADGNVRPLNVRIISTCTPNIEELVSQNQLRRDLYYALSAELLRIPPLREHPEDIEELLWDRIRHNRSTYSETFTEIPEDTLSVLRSYLWPDNVSELNHVVDHAMDVASGTVFRPEYLPDFILQHSHLTMDLIKPDRPKKRSEPLPDLLEEYESSLIRSAFADCSGNISKTAEALGITRQSLQYKLKKYGISSL